MTATTDRPDRDEWLGIEMRHLAALAAVANEASFSGAAETLGYVQSAVSQQVAYLERIVGRELVERSAKPRSVALTDAGEVLFDHIAEIFTQLRLAKTEIATITRAPDTPPTLGVATTFGPWLPLELLLATHGQDAGFSCGLVRQPECELLDAVSSGCLDAACVELPIASGPFFAMELLRQHCVLVAPARAATDLSVEGVLREWPLVTIEGCAVTRQLLAASEPRPAEARHSAQTPEAALSFVQAATAAAVMLPRDLAEHEHDVAVVPLDDLPPRVLGLVWHREHGDSPGVEALQALARRVFPRAAAGS